MKRKSIWKRITAATLAGMMAVSLAACGSSGGGGSKGDDQTVSDSTFVWVPSYMSLSAETDSYSRNLAVTGDRLYYTYNVYGEMESTSDFRYLDLNNPDAEPVVVMDMTQADTSEEDYSEYISNAFAAQDGGIVIISQRSPIITGDGGMVDWERQQQETTYSMKKLSEDGTELFHVDITEYLRMDAENAYLQYAISDKDSNLYLSNGNSYVWIFDKDGNHLTDVKIESGSQYSYINALGILADGRVAIVQDGGNSMEIKVYNEATKSFSDTYKNLPPNCWNTGIAPGIDGGVLLNGNDALYEYDLETQTYTEILKWIDCDINPDYIDFVTSMPDGRIAAYSRDWNTNETNLIILTKTPASEVVQKETLTLGCMSLSQTLQSAIVDFNKNSDAYRIEVKDYTASIDWSADNGMTAYEDAITQFNNDILTGNAPDLFATDNLNLNLLAAKGAIEDLSPYLESSTVVKREDLFEPVLKAYTKADVLCAIPTTFYVNTLVGRTAEVGEEAGWTLDEMLDYAKQYPDAEIFTYASRSSVLQYCLMFDMDSYVNWETGECSFDTPEFKKILEFAAGYPEEPDYETSEPKRLGNHEALLSVVSFSEAYDWQVQELMFGEPVTAIGFPSGNSTGVMVNGDDSVCISATSKNKEAAWSFIESLLSEEAQEDNYMSWGFPIRRDAFDRMMEEAMVPDYQYDENGEVMLDENGDPVEVSHMSYGWDDVTFDIYSVKQDEVDHITDVIGQIGGVLSWNQEWMNIVTEETESYFAGQKTVDEVAEIIQSRVQIYVNESR
ncbi:MAG: ABC transporter substrate-binding protein [Lachnospiraceae bacterium]